MAYCPFKFTFKAAESPPEYRDQFCYCEQDKCEWWEYNLWRCSIHALAFLKAKEETDEANKKSKTNKERRK